MFQVLKTLWRERNNRIDKIDRNFHAVFLNKDRRLYAVEEKLQQSKVQGFYY